MGSLDGIDVFVKVVQCKSFTGAAKLLGMPVTTVSGKIRELEKRLGVTLIHRTTRKLSITEAGQLYFKYCSSALAEVSEAENALKNSLDEPEGLLRITAAPDIGHAVLPDLIRKYLLKFPKMKVELLLTNRMMDLVGESVDLALRAGSLPDSTLIARKFKETEGLFWASPRYVNKHGLPKSPSDLQNHIFLGIKMLGKNIKLHSGKKTVSVSPDSRLILDDMQAVKSFILAGDGIGVMPSIICENELKAGKIVQIFPGWSIDAGAGARVTMSFVYPAHKFVPAKVKAFLDLACSSSVL